MDKNFPEGVCIIFGGSGGIGKGVAAAFGKAGSDVAVCYRTKADVAEQAAASIRATGVRASIHQVDVRDPTSVDAAVSAVAAEHGRIHSAVWGAGPLVEQTPLAEWNAELFRNAMETEAFGFYNATRALIPHMRAKGGGAFVHLGSAGHDWWPKLDGLSVVPKAANEALIKGIAKEEGAYEIRANSVLVGVIDAGMFHELSAQGVFDEKWIAETHKLLCLKRWARQRISAMRLFSCAAARQTTLPDRPSRFPAGSAFEAAV
jgi:3-oxoacyl-[acyl-carrier protein] reductase